MSCGIVDISEVTFAVELLNCICEYMKSVNLFWKRKVLHKTLRKSTKSKVTVSDHNFIEENAAFSNSSSLLGFRLELKVQSICGMECNVLLC